MVKGGEGYGGAGGWGVKVGIWWGGGAGGEGRGDGGTGGWGGEGGEDMVGPEVRVW